MFMRLMEYFICDYILLKTILSFFHLARKFVNQELHLWNKNPFQKDT